MKQFFKLFFGAYFIVLVPFFTAMFTTIVAVNSGLLASHNGYTDINHVRYLLIFLMFVEQIAATIIVQTVLFRRENEGKKYRCESECCESECCE